jgi:hypothetical protein
MKSLALKRFTNHIFLKRLGRDLLDQFFERFPERPDLTHLTQLSDLAVKAPAQSGDSDYYSALAAFFMRTERLPPALIEDLLAIEEMSTRDGLARLDRSREWPRLQPLLRPDSTAEDIAMQIWLIAPEVLAREHNTLRFRRLTSFEHAAHPMPRNADSNLPYRRFPIGRAGFHHTVSNVRGRRRLEALRYSRLELCVTKTPHPNTQYATRNTPTPSPPSISRTHWIAGSRGISAAAGARRLRSIHSRATSGFSSGMATSSNASPKWTASAPTRCTFVLAATTSLSIRTD